MSTSRIGPDQVVASRRLAVTLELVLMQDGQPTYGVMYRVKTPFSARLEPSHLLVADFPLSTFKRNIDVQPILHQVPASPGLVYDSLDYRNPVTCPWSG